MIDELINRVKRKWARMRLQPIRVFCFHQVSEWLDESIYAEPDWTALVDLKRRIRIIREEGYSFISLQDAYRLIKEDKVRMEKYAVLTCDDGLKCQATLIPWLEEQKIPMTMFVSVKNLDGETCGEQILEYFGITDKKQEIELAHKLYLTEAELHHLCSPYLEIGMHGYEHNDVSRMPIYEFEKSVHICRKTIQTHPRYVSFYAYAYGKHSIKTDEILRNVGVVPVYMDGQKNYNDASCIHRELL